MSIWLPDRPFAASARWAPVDAGGVLRSPLGGGATSINRLGDKHGIIMDFQPMEYVPYGARWASRIAQASKSAALCYVPRQLRIYGDDRLPGAPVVDGSDNAGMVLKLKGLVPNYGFAEYQPISVIEDGKRYLYLVASSVQGSAGGTVSLPITTMLWKPLSNGATVEIVNPVIEGTVSREMTGPGVSKFGTSAFETLTITEG